MSSIPAGLKVFVVDDEHLIAFTLSTILRQQGFIAMPFTSPLKALEAAANERPHLLISDVMMPGLSGVELAIEIKKQCPECKVLLFSGQAATAGLLEDARGSGHDFTLLAKPIHPTDLIRAVRASWASPFAAQGTKPADLRSAEA